MEKIARFLGGEKYVESCHVCGCHGIPENAKGGGKKEGGAKPHEETPHGKQFPTPLTSVRFAPSYGISLSKSLRNPQNFPQVTSSETVFGGPQKIVSDGPSSRGFAFRYVLPPPLALPRYFRSRIKFRRVTSSPDPDTFEKYRNTPPISIAIVFQKYAFWPESSL